MTAPAPRTPKFETRSSKADGTLFPFSGPAATDDDRSLLLHYIADFVMSTQPTLETQ